MECESMHSAINTEFKRVGKALWPGDRKKICWFKVKKDTPFEYFYKESFGAHSFKRVDCKKKVLCQLSLNLTSCYPNGHPISDKKHKILMSLFSMKPPALIMDYYDFHAKLQHGKVQEEEEED
nr:unnamed protein product [Callosobruchus chinensis]